MSKKNVKYYKDFHFVVVITLNNYNLCNINFLYFSMILYRLGNHNILQYVVLFAKQLSIV